VQLKIKADGYVVMNCNEINKVIRVKKVVNIKYPTMEDFSAGYQHLSLAAQVEDW